MFAAETFTECMRRVVERNDAESWQRLLMFAPACLRCPPRAGRRSPTPATVVKRRIQEFLNGVQVQSQPPPRARGTGDVAKAVSAKLSDGDIRGAVRIASSDGALLSANADAATALRGQHPPPHPASVYPEPPRPGMWRGLALQTSAVAAAIRSFPNGSSGGMDGLRPQHLKDMTGPGTGGAGSALLDVLCSLGNLMLDGRVPDEVTPLLYGASLCALSKKDGGARPIAVGNTIRRVVAKCCVRICRDSSVGLVGPHQFGFGSPNGCEIAAHASRIFCSAPGGSNRLICKIDFKNAFNSVRRDVILSLVLQYVPELYPFVFQCYRHATTLSFGDFIIESVEGVQQGDPLGPLLFCLAIKELIGRLRSTLNVWYLDDGTLGGDADVVRDDLQVVISTAADIGLAVNTQKCEVLVLDDAWPLDQRLATYMDFQRIAPGIRIMERPTAQLLGAALFPEGVDSVLTDKIRQLETLVGRLVQLDRHDALFILKNCFAIPRLIYALRTCPCFYSTHLTRYDQALRDGLELIANTRMDDASWQQATLPVVLGGLGIRCASDLALPAFISSTASVEKAVAKVLGVSVAADPPRDRALQLVGPAPGNPTSQKEWDLALSRARYDNLINDATDARRKVRLLAAAAPHSGAWLNALPSSSLGLKLTDEQARISVAVRIGAPLCQPHNCQGCDAPVDRLGTHGLGCRKSAGRHARHSTVNGIIKRSLVSAGVPSVLEPTGVSRSDGKRPDGMTLVPWKRGRALVWDYTCVDTLAASNIRITSACAGAAAEKALRAKELKYADLPDSVTFVPLAMETLGSWAADSLCFLGELSRRLIAQTGERRSGVFLLQALSIAVQRGNSASIQGTIPSTQKLDEVYDLF